MCGRYALTLPPAAVRAYFRYVERPEFPPRENIAPTQPVAILCGERLPSGEVVRRFALVRWAFVPAFVKDPRTFPVLFNARVESAGQKPSFRNALARRRCVFMADGFYEWRRPPGPARARGRAIPYLFRGRGGGPLGFAGIFETWTGPNGEEIDGACILTMSANADVVPVHDRMPALVEPELFDAWLDPGQDNIENALALLRAPAAGALQSTQVDPRGASESSAGEAEAQESPRLL